MRVEEIKEPSQLLDNRQQELYQLLAERDPCLAELYYEGIQHFNSQPQPNANRTRIVIICHCFRELMNSLPAVLGSESHNNRDEQNSHIKELSETWKTYHAVPEKMPVFDKQDSSPSSPEMGVIEKDILIAVQRLVFSQKFVQNSNKKNNALFLSDGHSDTFAVEAWSGAQRFFAAHAHFDRKFNIDESSLTLPSDDEICTHINEAETVMRAKLDSFFKTYDELEDILAEANEENIEDGE